MRLLKQAFLALSGWDRAVAAIPAESAGDRTFPSRSLALPVSHKSFICN